MKFIIRRADLDKKAILPCKNAQKDKNNNWIVEINTLSELIELMKEVNDKLILDFDDDDLTPVITIYDDYIE